MSVVAAMHTEHAGDNTNHVSAYLIVHVSGMCVHMFIYVQMSICVHCAHVYTHV